MIKDRKPWGGIFPALCTPFDQRGGPDLAAQRAIVRFAIASGADGVVCFGLAGEVNKLTPEERKLLGRTIVEEVAGRLPVLIGVGAEALHTAIDLAEYATGIGADGLVIPPPITAHVGAEELEGYFRAIAAATPLPIVIQDAPEYLGVSVSPQSVLKLSEVQPNIRYMKIETGPEGTERWVTALSPRVGVFTGGAGLNLLHDFRLGVVGNIPGTELTDLLVDVNRCRMRGEAERASTLFRALLPYLVFSLQGIDHYNACTKEMLVRRGVIARAGLRAPAPPLTPLAIDLLDSFAAELNLSTGRAAAAS